jgi:hypothetical protein
MFPPRLAPASHISWFLDLIMAANGRMLLLLGAFLSVRSSAQNTTDNLQYVDPLIGSANGGVYAKALP